MESLIINKKNKKIKKKKEKRKRKKKKAQNLPNTWEKNYTMTLLMLFTQFRVLVQCRAQREILKTAPTNNDATIPSANPLYQCGSFAEMGMSQTQTYVFL